MIATRMNTSRKVLLLSNLPPLLLPASPLNLSPLPRLRQTTTNSKSRLMTTMRLLSSLLPHRTTCLMTMVKMNIFRNSMISSNSKSKSHNTIMTSSSRRMITVISKRRLSPMTTNSRRHTPPTRLSRPSWRRMRPRSKQLPWRHLCSLKLRPRTPRSSLRKIWRALRVSFSIKSSSTALRTSLSTPS